MCRKNSYMQLFICPLVLNQALKAQDGPELVWAS